MRLGKHIDKKTDNWSKGSKKKLDKAIEHKMKRIYVGVLDALDREVQDGYMSKETAARLRAKILNIGNDQIRNIKLELDKYNVEFIAYHIEIRNPDGMDIPQGELNGKG